MPSLYHRCIGYVTCTIGGGQVQRTCIQEVGQSNYGTCIRIFVEAKPVVHE